MQHSSGGVQSRDQPHIYLQCPNTSPFLELSNQPEKFMEFDEDFQEEFSNIVSNDDIKEADDEFTPEVFDDTYLNMELAIPGGDGAQLAFARVTK